MYLILTASHSALRWLVLISLGYAIFRAYRGYFYSTAFSATDNLVRHGTATLAHIQLMIGIILYVQSPGARHFWNQSPLVVRLTDVTFFGLIHPGLMFTAIVVLTVGSAFAKRQATDRKKFGTMLVWFLIALVIILVAIPWPFSPLAQRPYLKTF